MRECMFCIVNITVVQIEQMSDVFGVFFNRSDPLPFLCFVFTLLFFLFFSLFSSLSFPFSFLFLFPDWMNLCSVLFLPLCLSHNTPGQGWSILYITSATQRGTVTSTKSFTLCMVTWREWTMHDFFCLIFIFEAWIQFFPTHSQTKYRWHDNFSFFFLAFLPKPPIWSPNVSVHHFLRGLWLLWLCQICLCSDGATVFTGVFWETHCFSQPASRDFIQTVISLRRWTRV